MKQITLMLLILICSVVFVSCSEITAKNEYTEFLQQLDAADVSVLINSKQEEITDRKIIADVIETIKKIELGEKANAPQFRSSLESIVFELEDESLINLTFPLFSVMSDDIEDPLYFNSSIDGVDALQIIEQTVDNHRPFPISVPFLESSFFDKIDGNKEGSYQDADIRAYQEYQAYSKMEDNQKHKIYAYDLPPSIFTENTTVNGIDSDRNIYYTETVEGQTVQSFFSRYSPLSNQNEILVELPTGYRFFCNLVTDRYIIYSTRSDNYKQFARLRMLDLQTNEDVVIYEHSSDTLLDGPTAGKCSISNGKVYFAGVYDEMYGQTSIFPLYRPYSYDIESKTLTELQNGGALSSYPMAYKDGVYVCVLTTNEISEGFSTHKITWQDEEVSSTSYNGVHTFNPAYSNNPYFLILNDIGTDTIRLIRDDKDIALINIVGGFDNQNDMNFELPCNDNGIALTENLLYDIDKARVIQLDILSTKDTVLGYFASDTSFGYHINKYVEKQQTFVKQMVFLEF